MLIDAKELSELVVLGPTIMIPMDLDYAEVGSRLAIVVPGHSAVAAFGPDIDPFVVCGTKDQPDQVNHLHMTARISMN